jgi:DNA-binding CsgD family transcriptional regulator/tetratricopeptide (TPR) repeat protein
VRGASDADWELVGRREELDLVVECLRSDERRPIVIGGPAGVGKSRLAAEACRVVGTDLTVEWCPVTHSSASIPFGPVTRLLAPGGGTGTLADTLRLSIDAMAARPEPTVVAVDDAQLLDDASAVLVHQLAVRHVATVLLTIRTGEPSPGPVTALWKDDAGVYLELQALSQEETRALVAEVLGGPVEEQTLARLWDVTGGNLLFLREVLRAADADGSLVSVRGLWRWRGSVGAPRRIADLVNARIGDLDPGDRALLSLVAFAEPIPLAMLRRVTDSDQLARLGQRGLIVPEGTDPSSPVRLAHPLYSEVLRAEFSTLQEVEACRQLTEAALELGMARGPHSRWVSAWALEAGVELPAEFVVDAARAAIDAADPRRAEQLARAAFARRRSFDVALVLGEALLALQRYPEAVAAFRDAAELSESDQQFARAAMGHAQALHFGLGDLAASDAVLTEAAARVADQGWRDVLAAQRARSFGFAGRFEEAGEIAVGMLDSPDERVQLRALSPATTLLALRGQTDRVLSVTAALFEPAQRLRAELPHAPMWVASSRAPALMLAGELEQAIAMLDAIERSARILDPEDRGYMIIAYGRLALYQGRVVTAARVLRDGVSLLDDANRAGRQGWGLCLLAESLALAGDLTGAELAAAEAEATPRPTNPIYQGDAERASAWILACSGRTSAAEAALVDVADRNRVGAPASEIYALHDIVRLGRAAVVADRLIALASMIDGRAAPAFADHARAAADGDGVGLDRVSEQFESFGALLYAAEVAAEATATHRDAGRTGSASLSRAHAISLAAHCEGATTPALALLHDDDDGLTRREREIAQLAASGMSSPEIAKELVVSVRTVDNHLQHAYAKLGISKRSELGPRLTPS